MSDQPDLGLADPRPPALEGWILPAGWAPVDLGRCRGCDAVVLWCLTRLDRRAPIDRDGTNHFATCPQAQRFRRRR